MSREFLLASIGGLASYVGGICVGSLHGRWVWVGIIPVLIGAYALGSLSGKCSELIKALRKDNGVVIAEAAIILPVLVFVALALIDIQWMTRTAAAIEYIVTETARCEALQSGACTAPNSAQTYAEKLAKNMRLDTNPAAFHLSADLCSPTECDVSLTYNYKALGAWFPRITIQRTGSAAVAPPAGGQP